MKVITINLSEPHIKALQVLQDIGLYISRSEAIRVAVRDFLQKELGLAEKLNIDVLGPQSTTEERKREISRLIRKLEKDQRVETSRRYARTEVERYVRKAKREKQQEEPDSPFPGCEPVHRENSTQWVPTMLKIAVKNHEKEKIK